MCRHEVWVHPSILISRTIYSWLQIFFYTHFEYFVFKKQSPLVASHLYKNIKSLEIEETKIWSLTSQKFSHFCLMWDFSCLVVQGLLCHIFLFVCLFHNTPEGLLLQLTWLNWCLMCQRLKSSLLGPESAPDHFLRVILPLALHFPVNCLPCPVKWRLKFQK